MKKSELNPSPKEKQPWENIGAALGWISLMVGGVFVAVLFDPSSQSPIIVACLLGAIATFALSALIVSRLELDETRKALKMEQVRRREDANTLDAMFPRTKEMREKGQDIDRWWRREPGY